MQDKLKQMYAELVQFLDKGELSYYQRELISEAKNAIKILIAIGEQEMAKKKIIGYKAFNSDWTCRDIQYEVGKTYTKKEKPEVCSVGFHFCLNIADCFKYYLNNPECTKIAQIEALGDISESEDDSKCATNKIKIVKEISFNEAYELGNQGKANIGFYNTGNWNTGNRNTGNRNTGYRNTGNSNTGYRNTGNYNTSNYNTGNSNTGYCNTGNYNTGNSNTGYCNTGNYNTANYNTGYCNTGNCNTGCCNTGNRNTGYYNTGMFNSCNYANGLFNTKSPKISMFNKPTKLTFEEFQEKYPEAFNLLFYSNFQLTRWVCEDEMTDEEKEAHPEYKTTGGYLKRKDYKETCLEMWNGFNEKERNEIKKLPNFDKDIFKEITGIEV